MHPPMGMGRTQWNEAAYSLSHRDFLLNVRSRQTEQYCWTEGLQKPFSLQYLRRHCRRCWGMVALQGPQ